MLLGHPDVGLMNEGGGLQRMPGALTRQITPRQAAQLVIDRRRQIVESRFGPVHESPAGMIRSSPRPCVLKHYDTDQSFLNRRASEPPSQEIGRASCRERG